MNQDLLKKIRLDSLAKHDGATRKYGRLPLDSCLNVIINRPVNAGPTKVVFEEMDGFGHGVNVPQHWINEDHIGGEKISCLRCAGAGKLTIGGIDCTECHGTGMINKVSDNA
jgi:hypothetical protein